MWTASAQLQRRRMKRNWRSNSCPFHTEVVACCEAAAVPLLKTQTERRRFVAVQCWNSVWLHAACQLCGASRVAAVAGWNSEFHHRASLTCLVHQRCPHPKHGQILGPMSWSKSSTEVVHLKPSFLDSIVKAKKPFANGEEFIQLANKNVCGELFVRLFFLWWQPPKQDYGAGTL